MKEQIKDAAGAAAIAALEAQGPAGKALAAVFEGAVNDTVAIQIKVPKALHKRLKVMAIEADLQLGQLVLNLLELGLNVNEGVEQ